MKKNDTNVAEVCTTGPTEMDHVSDIPENLAALTMQCLAIHAANDDMAWVEDMIAEIQ